MLVDRFATAPRNDYFSLWQSKSSATSTPASRHSHQATALRCLRRALLSDRVQPLADLLGVVAEIVEPR
jgi:hypothetical protein